MTHSWNLKHWQNLMTAYRNDKLSHALLFLGIPGLGQLELAKEFARVVLCRQLKTDNTLCEHCHACHLMQAGNHPDFHLIEPEETGQMIKIDQIRQVNHNVNETASQSGYRVIIIHPANALNIQAANALLKTLEEPTPKTLFILISTQNLRLPATIISRCQKMVFHKPDTETALNWLQTKITDKNIDIELLLKLAGGAPLAALQLSEENLLALRQEFYQGLFLLIQKQMDPLQLAAQYHEQNSVLILNLLLTLLQDLLRYKLTADQTQLINSDCQEWFVQFDKHISKTALLNFIDYAQKTYSFLLSSLNLNKQLLLEDLFIRWVTALC